ncbi:amidohydrolase family protein [Marinobacter sp. CHS3-4]|uniref:amidohydrolase family protein n=1 Tax=Marinobacter sp. CHS3-4 TaxID=3045174 RepID=UPI0024B48954|nr:amidohydrolase family protein [Marinobacter sp. CHS3-4]MDI9245363.1 amidohydrolase family protein [Marinobacter sp. CHS3-4]
MAKEPWLEPLLKWTGQTDSLVIPSVDSTLEAMNEAGVDISILSAWHGPGGSLISNQEVATQIDQAPERFRGLVSVDLNRPMEAVREIRRWVDNDRFVGVRVVPWLWDLPPNDRKYYPIYTACVDLGVPFCTQIGHTGPLLRSETGRPIPYLEDVLLDFPELKVVGGHVGFPWIDELISLTIKFPNFYVDTSAYALHRLPTSFVDFLKGMGSKRVMFGTNWPMLSPAQCLKHLESLGLSEEQRSNFLGNNAMRVFVL